MAIITSGRDRRTHPAFVGELLDPTWWRALLLVGALGVVVVAGAALVVRRARNARRAADGVMRQTAAPAVTRRVVRGP